MGDAPRPGGEGGTGPGPRRAPLGGGEKPGGRAEGLGRCPLTTGKNPSVESRPAAARGEAGKGCSRRFSSLKGNLANSQIATCPNAAGMLTKALIIHAKQQLSPRRFKFPYPASHGAGRRDSSLGQISVQKEEPMFFFPRVGQNSFWILLQKRLLSKRTALGTHACGVGGGGDKG